MTIDAKQIYIDEDTYFQITGINDKEEYKNFLKSNKRFVDVSKPKEEKSSIIEEKNKELEEKHKKADDLRYIPSLIWLEQYLGRYEIVYGKFKYTSDKLSNKEKCEELLDYYSTVCGLDKIEDIFKKRPHKGIHR